MSLSHLIYKENPTKKYKVALLIKDTCFNAVEIQKYYIQPLEEIGVNREDVIVYNLAYTPTNKAPATLIKSYLSNLLRGLKATGTELLLVADSNYFKKLVKETKTEPLYGHILPCKFPGFESFKATLTLNYASLFYDPTQQTKIDRSLICVKDFMTGIIIAPGANIIHSDKYIEGANLKGVLKELQKLQKYPALTCDIETAGLKFYEAKEILLTIAFAWDKHNGIVIDLRMPKDEASLNNAKILLRGFFETYTGNLIYHNANFDVKILIFSLFMNNDESNMSGLLEGLEIMYRNTDCTKLISYLATNSTAGNNLGLKDLAAEFAGNYGHEIYKNILEYNLKDTLCTWYVYDKYYPKMVADQQLSVYETIFKPSMKTITQMELTGLPLNSVKVSEAEDKLKKVLKKHTEVLESLDIVKEFEKVQRLDRLITKQAKLKVKKITIDDIPEEAFNPGSSQQIGHLLHEHLGIPVIDKTPTGAPSVGAKSLEKIRNTLISKFNITDEDLK